MTLGALVVDAAGGQVAGCSCDRSGSLPLELKAIILVCFPIIQQSRVSKVVTWWLTRTSSARKQPRSGLCKSHCLE
jgi:hypothetical protein